MPTNGLPLPSSALAHRVDRAQVGRRRPREVAGKRHVVFERKVDHAIRGSRPLAETVEIVEVAAPNRRPGCQQGSRGRVGSREPEHLMAGGQ